jgi:hypothetical protein
MLSSVLLYPKNVQFLFQLLFLPIHSEACMSHIKRNIFKCNFLMTTCFGSLNTLYWKPSLAPRMKATSRTTSVIMIYQLPTWCINYYLFIKCYVPLRVSNFKYSSSGGYTVYMFVVACRCTVWVRTLTQTVHRQVTTNSRREWQYHMLHVYSVSSWRWVFKARNM